MMLRNHRYIAFVVCFTSSTTCFADFIPSKIATGAAHTCALSTDGAIKCWGFNNSGQLGTGDTRKRGSEAGTMGANLPSIDLGLSTTDKAVDICAGQFFTCALTQSAGVKCWGHNGSGQLGQGVTKNTHLTMGKDLPVTNLGTDFKGKALACGANHACALSDKGLMKCWGANSNGMLGLGNKISRGRRSEDMGDNLPALAGLTNIQSISAGYGHTCALSAEGLRCWGFGAEGQLGLESGQPMGNTPETAPGKLPFINVAADPNEKILSMTTGFTSTCALMTKKDSAGPNNSFVKCWGENIDGTLGTGNTFPYGLKPGTMGAALPRLNLELDEIVSLNQHFYSTCALSKSGHIKCWGGNEVGELGLGDVQLRGAAPSDMGKNLPDVDLGLPAKAISAGSSSSHSCAILINNQIKCWGSGSDGQLGYENNADVGTMSGQMGDALPFVRIK